MFDLQSKMFRIKKRLCAAFILNLQQACETRLPRTVRLSIIPKAMGRNLKKKERLGKKRKCKLVLTPSHIMNFVHFKYHNANGLFEK